MIKFGFGGKKEKALEGALEEEISGRQRERVLNADTQEALALLAQENEAEALKNAQEAERLRELSTKDELTGILNRRAFLEEAQKIASGILPEETLRSTRKEGFRSLTLVMIDIDHFKSYNDTLGHPGGDVLLQQIARHLAGKLRIRPTDFVGRYGGEEFLVALPGASEKDVMEKLAMLRQEIGESGQTGVKFMEVVKGVPLIVTMSCGIASYRPGEDLNETIERADKALYFAKKNGRDQARIYNPEMAAGSS